MKYNRLNISLYIVLFFAGIGLPSCREFLETPLPNDQLSTETVFKSKETIRDVVNGMYNSYTTQHNGFIIRK